MNKPKENTSAARVLIPLLDALNWKGDNGKMIEAMTESEENMDTDGLLGTLANLNFKNFPLGRRKAETLDVRMLPVLVVKGFTHILIINMEEGESLIFDGDKGIYRQEKNGKIFGDCFSFHYADNVGDSLLEPQDHWFRKLLYRFRKSFITITSLTFLITVLDLLLPVFVILIYDQIPAAGAAWTLLLILSGVLIYIFSSFSLNRLRGNILNYMSNRMGYIISKLTFARLVYLSPSYTELASISSQIARIKDFENLKRFVTSGNLIELFDLAFSVVYIGAIFVIGGWIGVIPICTLLILIFIGVIMRPFHKIKMERVSESTSQKQQSLLEILKNVNEIRLSGSKQNWIERVKKQIGDSIMQNYQLSKYVSASNAISYFITNASALIILYGGVQQVFIGKMTTGTLIGVLMLYWKTTGSIRNAFSLSVQINGLIKSIGQIDRFMKLPQDSSAKSSMIATKEIAGRVRFSEVSIRYNPSANPALVNISFEAKPGEIFGILGHDGAGKSTILKLILGMYTPQAGRIIIDNSNIKQLEPLLLRRKIGYAPEKDLFFLGTIRENFKCYNPEISDERILELAEKTGLKSYFDFLGYDLDTTVDEKLSKELPPAFCKLFNLTRMFLRNAKIYLIDEPEDHLDRGMVEKVISVIVEFAKERDATVIITSKDEQIISICDRVIQLNQGKLSKVE